MDECNRPAPSPVRALCANGRCTLGCLQTTGLHRQRSRGVRQCEHGRACNFVNRVCTCGPQSGLYAVLAMQCRTPGGLLIRLLLPLHPRTGNRSEGAKHTTITVTRPQSFPTLGTLIQKLSRILGHVNWLHEFARWADYSRCHDHRSHGCLLTLAILPKRWLRRVQKIHHRLSASAVPAMCSSQ